MPNFYSTQNLLWRGRRCRIMFYWKNFEKWCKIACIILKKIFLQNQQNWKKRIWMFLPISLDSDKVQKHSVPCLKAENLIITVHFMHFLRKITVRAATDQNVCIIFFVTVSSTGLQWMIPAIMGHPRMISDFFGPFLTYLPTSIRF